MFYVVSNAAADNIFMILVHIKLCNKTFVV